MMSWSPAVQQPEDAEKNDERDLGGSVGTAFIGSTAEAATITNIIASCALVS